LQVLSILFVFYVFNQKYLTLIEVKLCYTRFFQAFFLAQYVFPNLLMEIITDVAGKHFCSFLFSCYLSLGNEL